jgi:hypothetical protein
MTMFRSRTPIPSRLSSVDFVRALRWIDKRPLGHVVEPYRLRLFQRFFDERDAVSAVRPDALRAVRRIAHRALHVAARSRVAVLHLRQLSQSGWARVQQLADDVDGSGGPRSARQVRVCAAARHR